MSSGSGSTKVILIAMTGSSATVLKPAPAEVAWEAATHARQVTPVTRSRKHVALAASSRSVVPAPMTPTAARTSARVGVATRPASNESNGK